MKIALKNIKQNCEFSLKVKANFFNNYAAIIEIAI